MDKAKDRIEKRAVDRETRTIDPVRITLTAHLITAAWRVLCAYWEYQNTTMYFFH